MKAKLIFTLPEEYEDFEHARKGSSYRDKLDDIWNDIFRPHFKHGYSDPELHAFSESELGGKIMTKLADMYHEIVNEKL